MTNTLCKMVDLPKRCELELFKNIIYLSNFDFTPSTYLYMYICNYGTNHIEKCNLVL